MENNIKNLNIYLRNIILELRYDPNPIILDLRGQLINRLISDKKFKGYIWSLTDKGIVLNDKESKDESLYTIIVEIDRLSYISRTVASSEDHFNRFKKILELIFQSIDNVKLRRIGCRVQGVYKVLSKDYSKIFNSFKDQFKTNLFLNDFPSKDLKLLIEYENGRYETGPIGKNDSFVRTNFPNNTNSSLVGIAIDTDNYVIFDDFEVDKNKIESNTKRIYDLSLTVEKTLYERMKEF
ncbi:hypothetical protein K4L44_05880 [Halosquirtibacter laminarini]|uniref:Uncharacterized protein n=1 Tax=Halosquirtibacter laminarini TaxID=3374600 RepID=A0AC61NM36_9BACT|nr:hypothetical protein K4L44_05880 [Prolixibacteraceae bacterium]